VDLDAFIVEEVKKCGLAVRWRYVELATRKEIKDASADYQSPDDGTWQSVGGHALLYGLLARMKPEKADENVLEVLKNEHIGYQSMWVEDETVGAILDLQNQIEEDYPNDLHLRTQMAAVVFNMRRINQLLTGDMLTILALATA
jgi:hypothetical protein